MDSLKAFRMGKLNRNKEQMVFDWDKAARLIKENNPKCAGAGLRDDWEWTGGVIYQNGDIVKDTYTFLSSTWAVPELDLDGVRTPCYKMQSEVREWKASTKWPKSAREILEEK